MNLFIPCHRWPNSKRQQSQQSQQSRHAKWLLLGFQGDSWQLQHFFLCEYMARCNRMTTGYIMIYWWKGICWRLCTKAGYPSKCAGEIHRPQRRWQAKASRTGLLGLLCFCRTFLMRRIIGAWDPAASDARCFHVSLRREKWFAAKFCFINFGSNFQLNSWYSSWDGSISHQELWPRWQLLPKTGDVPNQTTSSGFSGWLYSICIVWIHGKAQSHVNFNLIFGLKWHPARGEQRFGGRTVK